VDRMRKEGLVALSANPAHKSSPLVNLTEEARRIVPALVEARARAAKDLTSLISPELASEAHALVKKLRDLVRKANEVRKTAEGQQPGDSGPEAVAMSPVDTADARLHEELPMSVSQ